MESPLPIDHQPSQSNRRQRGIFAALIVLLVVVVGVVIGMMYYAAARRVTPDTTPVATSVKKPLQPAKIQLTLLAKGLPHPTGIVSTNQTSDRRLFVLDRAGYIRIVDQKGTVMPGYFLDISNKVLADGEMGLLGLAFSPHYPQDGNFFVNYVDKNQNTVIERYHVSADVNRADAASAKMVLSVKQPYTNHNGGDLTFGPDGYLYATLGDGGSAGDPENRAQNTNTFFGKILRLDVAQLPYKIPTSNPFAGQAGKAPEVWDYGLRNAWRISFDRQTHDLYIADVGQGEVEEVNVEAAGGRGGNNYGWRCYEGSKAFKTDGCGPRTGYVFPVAEYDHKDGRCSITGGYVYRGHKYPALAGKYFYGDYCNGELYDMAKQNGTWQARLHVKSGYQISTFGQDSQGELYLADFATGTIYQIQDSAN